MSDEGTVRAAAGFADALVDGLAATLGQAAPHIAAGLVIIVAAVAIAEATRRALRHLARRLADDREAVVRLAAQVAYVGVVVIGVVSGLGTMGIDVSALIAGLGLTGFALGFALRDALSNLVAGVLIIFYRPFRVGDTVTIAGVTGEVRSVDFRYTTLAVAEQTVFFPNATVFTSTVTVA